VFLLSIMHSHSTYNKIQAAYYDSHRISLKLVPDNFHYFATSLLPFYYSLTVLQTRPASLLIKQLHWHPISVCWIDLLTQKGLNWEFLTPPRDAANLRKFFHFMTQLRRKWSFLWPPILWALVICHIIFVFQ
jgi:hypothetical protein